LISGIFVSTILTLVVIPTLYYTANYKHPERLAQVQTTV
jgi:Cu/Ag efflux pump CusA